MANSILIIFSGGHATCFETIKHNKPSIIVPTQPEQTGNGRKLQQLKCSILARNGKQLVSAIEEIQSNPEAYKQNVQKLSSFSRKFDGLKEAAKVVENVLST